MHKQVNSIFFRSNHTNIVMQARKNKKNSGRGEVDWENIKKCWPILVDFLSVRFAVGMGVG